MIKSKIEIEKGLEWKKCEKTKVLRISR